MMMIRTLPIREQRRGRRGRRDRRGRRPAATAEKDWTKNHTADVMMRFRGPESFWIFFGMAVAQQCATTAIRRAYLSGLSK
jgi:hypothetical protein